MSTDTEPAWHLDSMDGFDMDAERFRLSGPYGTEEDALLAADARFAELEVLQPSAGSGGQAGIQDRLYLVRQQQEAVPAMTTDKPSPGILWHQARGDGDRYRELMRQHGHLLSPGDEGYEQASRTLPCGYPGPAKPESEWCELTDLLRESCSHCTGRGEPVAEEHDRSQLGQPFAARYPGSCAWCGDRFSEGDEIRRDGRGGNGNVCGGCSA